MSTTSLIGSVGQPRDGDRRAAYATYDSGTRMVTLCYADYDIASAQKRILDPGLPELLALHLGAGLSLSHPTARTRAAGLR